jgi:hypothetical protein
VPPGLEAPLRPPLGLDDPLRDPLALLELLALAAMAPLPSALAWLGPLLLLLWEGAPLPLLLAPLAPLLLLPSTREGMCSSVA